MADRFFRNPPNLARGLLYISLFWGEQQAVVAFVTAACNFSGPGNRIDGKSGKYGAPPDP
ncbi:MAG: hypothetical protein WC003_06995 [Terrimicrobiaceae bacterium]